MAFACERLALADVVSTGVFPEEMLRPIRESLGWGLSALLALHKDFDLSSDLPAPRLVQSELVEAGHLPEELAMRLAHIRELAEPAPAAEDVPPPSTKTAEGMLAGVQALIELAQKQVVALGL